MAGALSGPAPPPGDLHVLAAWAPELAETFVELSCDIALVVDGRGAIVKLTQRGAHPIVPAQALGQPWPDTTAADSQAKAREMLAELAATGVARRREINHPAGAAPTVAVAYAGVRLGGYGPTLLVGHDLRPTQVLQQRFVSAQEALERSYWQAQGALRRSGAGSAPPRMTERERASLGLQAVPAPGPEPTAAASPRTRREADDAELLRALDRLYDRFDQEALPGLLRDARRAAERHFLQHALQRAGGLDALARTLGMSPRALARRSGAPARARGRRGGGAGSA